MDTRYKNQRRVAFQDDPFLLSMTEEWSAWEGRDPNSSLVVAAVKGHSGTDWAAYFEDPYWGANRVADFGRKLPEDAARRLFPGEPWANLKYRRDL